MTAYAAEQVKKSSRIVVKIEEVKANLLVLALLLSALALRLVGITSQSFWFDEGWTSWAIGRSWTEMFRLLASDNHPPLYFVCLRLWAGIFGRSDLALRGFSALASLATAAAVFWLGALWDRRMGLAAGLLAALSPPLVIYGQEARMYSLVTLLIALATCFLARLADSQEIKWLWAYSVSMAAALYTHHFAWLAFGAHWALAMWLLRERRKLAIFPAVVLALYLPCLPLTIHQVEIARGMAWRPKVELSDMLKDVWLFLNLGKGPRRLLFTTGAALLALAGLALGWKSGKRRWALISASAILPPLATCGIQCWRPIYTDRYLLYTAPFLYLLMALGAKELTSALSPPGRRKWLREAPALAALIGLAAIPMGLALKSYYAGQGPLKADFRSVATHIEQVTSPGDSLALVQSAPPFLHYYRGDLPWQAFPGINAEDYVSSEKVVAEKLRRIARPGKVVWWIGQAWDVADPQNLVEAQLREHGTYWDERWWHESPGQEPVRVAAYVIQDTNFGAEPRAPVGANFGAELELLSYHVQGDRNALYVALWWRVLSRPSRAYNAFVHLIDGQGNIVSQGDHMLLNPFYPVNRWQVGQVWRDEHRIALPEGFEPEGVSLRVGLSWGEGGKYRLPVVEGRGGGQTYLILPLDNHWEQPRRKP